MKKPDKQWLERKINNGHSQEDVARSLNTTRYKVRKWAEEYGLKFNKKSIWRKY